MANFSDQLPISGATTVARTTIISFKANNDVDGIDINTLSVTINGTAAITNNAFVNSYTGQVFAGVGHFLVGIYPKGPDYLPDASQIDIVLSVNDGAGSPVTSSYSFFTTTYGAAGATPIPSTGIFGCTDDRPRFTPTDAGLTAALNNDIGTEVVLQWKTATVFDSSNSIFYNVYYNTLRRNVLDSEPIFLATAETIRIGGLTPGDTHFFLVRAAEFDTSLMNVPVGMRMAGNNLYFYPASVTLSSNISATATTILVNSTSGFPSAGIIRIDNEWIYYTGTQASPAAFITTAIGRGYGDSIGATHLSGASVEMWNGIEDENSTIAEATPAWEKPNFAATWVLTDGYGADGYRDGYDGYDSYYSHGPGANQNLDGVDGYWRYHQQPIDSINTDLTNNDASGDFPSFDFCRTYRTKSPASFWKGQGSGTYFGGLQWRDGYMIQETNVRNHMLQREELLLETTGEPMVLLRRVWTGIRCFCFRNRREHADARCPTCFSTGFQGGYTQFLNTRRSDRRILVRVDATTEDLNIGDKEGFDPMYEPNAWTLPFPGLRDRDILIRFNENNTEEFRYEILNVQRNRAFFGASGAQKFQMKRLTKTDIIYQYLAQRDVSNYPLTRTTSVSSSRGIVQHNHTFIIKPGISLASYNGMTSRINGHSHVVTNGIIQSILGHTHTIL